MRRAADLLHLHHSSVARRIEQLGEEHGRRPDRAHRAGPGEARAHRVAAARRLSDASADAVDGAPAPGPDAPTPPRRLSTRRHTANPAMATSRYTGTRSSTSGDDTCTDQPASRSSPSNTTRLTVRKARCAPMPAHSGARRTAVRAVTSIRPKKVSRIR
ncbi:hypothetical protein [Streptomyces venezuelae]|uniref:hypothetical protein n=1 Tax=Streptomyces venezuelae TaxID=54571 RepID=UPI0037A24486